IASAPVTVTAEDQCDFKVIHVTFAHFLDVPRELARRAVIFTADRLASAGLGFGLGGRYAFGKHSHASVISHAVAPGSVPDYVVGEHGGDVHPFLFRLFGE